MVMPETEAFAAMLSLELNSQPRSVPRQSYHVAAEPASETTLRDCSRSVHEHSARGYARSKRDSETHLAGHVQTAVAWSREVAGQQ